MKKILVTATGLLAMAGSALAADMPIKARPVAYSWDGCYVGATIGGKFGKATQTEAGDTVGNAFLGDSLAPDIHPRGILSGGDIGCDYQWSPNFVVGVVGDLAWSNADAEINLRNPPGNPAVMTDIREQWLGTARVRAGYGTDRWLVYVTGGWASSGVKWTGFQPAFIGAFGECPASIACVTQTKTMSGWTGGVGAEWRLSDSLSAKVEWLHVDLGSTVFNSPIPTPNTINFADRVRLTEEVIMGGLNYRFNWGGPVRASY